MMSKIEFLARSRQRKQEAQLLVDACPAEEAALSSDECLAIAAQLTDRADLELRFAVFELLCERFMR